MALMNSEVYDALVQAGASEEKARKAAESVAAYESRSSHIESDLSLLKWMVATNIAMTVTILWRVFTHV